MTHPEQLFETIIGQITTDDFTFYCGTKPDQNFDADDLQFPACFLDAPMSGAVETMASNARQYNWTISLFWAYKQDEIDDRIEQLLANKIKAREAAQELIFRLRQHESVVSISGEKWDDVDNVFDIDLHGVLQKFNLVLRSADAFCTT